MEQEIAAHTAAESDQQPHAVTTTPEQRSASAASPQAAGGQADDTYDDSVVQPTFNESANRRNLRVSRSGRFKEKRRTRVGLPDQYEHTDRVESPSQGDMN